MADDIYVSFLGRGWSFPPRFEGNGMAMTAGVVMTADEVDIQASLEVLFGTVQGERFLVPKYGLDMQELMFEPMSTTMRTLLLDRVRTAILIYEPRIRLLNLQIADPGPGEGVLRILLEYEVRASNSRFNLVYPFYRTDSNEVRGSVAGLAG